MRLSALSLLFPACALVGSERKTLDGEETIHWHRCQEPSSSDAFVIPAVVSSETERNPDGTKLALFQCWEFEYAVPSVPGLETASLIPWGNFAESFQFDIKGAYHQPPHAPPTVSLIVFIAGEGVTCPPSPPSNLLSSPSIFSHYAIVAWARAVLVVCADVNSSEGIMTIPGTGQKWRGRGGDILIAADTDGSHEMDWKAGTRVVDFSFSGLNAVPAHKVVPAREA
ncbi:hypothetical protein HOY82DRAFT_541304 [Tuber indicum]|nr:hypothetical protein HOY82DRAFT_541304 [Tuber indicum]